MGCGTASKPVVDVNAGNDSPNKKYKPVYSQIINDKCPRIRLDHSPSVKSCTIEGVRFEYQLKFCYVSQRGYYPNALDKANQDSYTICENILNDHNCHLFGIFDGHGEYGDYCSHYAAENVPICLEKELVSGGTEMLDGTSMESVYTKAFVKANKAMHKSNIDDSLSGTTGITIIVKGDTLYVGNVGDSRAIIASDVGGKLKYSPLSSDQTPFRKDERERLKKRGAKILTLDQIEGNEPIHENWGAESGDEIDEVGDPPRVWDQTLERPGCAFTRSLGDAVAEAVGVYAEPEIVTWKLNNNDRMAIIASDGVFEFLTSQAVVDIMSKFSNPIEGAKRVVDESYRLWLTYDDRTDDISIIILLFSDFKAKAGFVDSPRLVNAAPESIAEVESKPVRRVMSKAKRKDISENWNNDETEEFDISKELTPKTPEELSRISEMVRSNFMFQNLSPIQRDQIFGVMKLRSVTANELIIREGDKGDEMYIIDAGEFNVLKKDENGVNQTVFTYTTTGAAFGELSLMYGKPRAASIKAKTDGRLWCIGRQAFRAVLMKKKHEGLLKLWMSVPVLRDCPFPTLQRLCELTTEENLNDGEVIVKQEDSSNAYWTICLILQGGIKLTPLQESGKPQTRNPDTYLASMEVGQHFSSAIAMGKTKLSCIPRHVFLELVGTSVLDALQELVSNKRSRGKTLQRQQSIFSDTEKLMSRIDKHSRHDFKLETPLGTMGDYAYLGNFVHLSLGLRSAKVIAKQRASEARMDVRFAQELSFLVALSGANTSFSCLPSVISTFQNDKIAMLVFAEVFVCDLSVALANAAIPAHGRAYYAGCLLAAVAAMHEKGVISRAINPSSLFITNQGVVKLIDFRYSKKMDGSKSFTICGDPLYFAPEVVGQQGYDYGLDLWALGAVILEIYEGSLPWGSPESEETQIFKALSAFKPDNIKFTDKTPKEAREAISGLLQPILKNRLGYLNFNDLIEIDLFSGLSLHSLGAGKGFVVDVQAALDTSMIFDENAIESTNINFQQF